jgi:EAL domain-containing protein (putative c-di-GMP-specific phosphodiesterase class I)
LTDGIKIDEDQFKELPVAEQRVAMYRALVKLQKRKGINTAVSGAGGFLGGFTAMLLKLAFWK